MPPLTTNERYQIAVKIKLGFTNHQIASALKRHIRTIEREISRCGERVRYTHKRALAHRQRCAAISAANHPTHSPKDWLSIEAKIEKKNSPEQAKHATGLNISVSAIYRYLYRLGKLKLLKQLRHYTATKARSGNMKWIKKALRIKKRPKEVLTRDKMGHFEADSIVGKRNEPDKIVVMLDRATRYVRLGLARHGTAVEVACHMQRWEADISLPILTLTTDQGYEFSALTTPFVGRLYACDAGKPYQKGAVENINKLIRQYIPKGTSLRKITQAKLDWIANELNERVRKRLGWKTPSAVVSALTAATAS
jgi:IS30 family transposase